LSPQDSDAQYWLSRIEAIRHPQGSSIAANPSPPPTVAPPAPPATTPTPATPPTAQPAARPPSGEQAVTPARPAGRESDSHEAPHPPAQRSGRVKLPPVPAQPVVVRPKTDLAPKEQPSSTNTASASQPFTPVEDIEKITSSSRTQEKQTRLNYTVTSPLPTQESKGADETSNRAKPSVEPSEFDGLKHQIEGMNLQRQGKYAEARQEFQKALVEYRKQKASNIRVRDATEGIRYCEKAIQFCEANLR